MPLQELLWQSQSRHSVILMRMRWIPAESRKLWLCAITFDGIPEVRFWLWMLWHSADTPPPVHGGCTTFWRAGSGCTSLKHNPLKKGHNRNDQDCHWPLGSGVYAIVDSAEIKHCCLALFPSKLVQITMLFLLQFLTIGNLTYRTVIYKNRSCSTNCGKSPSIQALSFIWKKTTLSWFWLTDWRIAL